MCEFLLNGVGGGLVPTISACYYSKSAMDIVFERCQPHLGVIVVYEL